MKITNLLALDPYTLHLTFEDGVSGTIDLTPHSNDSIFHKLIENNLWETVKVIKDGTIIYRDDTIDIDSMSCYIKITGKNPFL